MRFTSCFISIAIVILGGTSLVRAAPPTPAGSFTGGSFSRYFQNIIENPCPVGSSITSYTSTAGSNYGRPNCVGYWSSTNAGTDIYFTGLGKVLIGTGASVGKLDVAGNTDGNIQAVFTRASDTNFQLQAVNRSTANTAGSLVSTFGVRYNSLGHNTAVFNFYRGGGAQDGKIALMTNNLDRLTVDANGNVGIGTGAPTQALDVAGNVEFGANSTSLLSGDQGGAIELGASNNTTPGLGTPYIDFHYTGIANDYNVRLVSDGTGQLTLRGNLEVTGNFSSSGYLEDKTGKVGRNLLNTTSWTATSGSIVGFNVNGSVAENIRIWGIDPHGRQSLLWSSPNDATSDADGGWNYPNIPIDNEKAYRLSVWIKRDNMNTGNIYLGADSANTNNLNGTANGNPYFIARSATGLVADRWYLLVGYIHAAGDTSTTSYSAMYDGVTGQRVTAGTDYKNRGATNFQSFRAYNYYDTDPTNTQYFWGPRFEEIDGNEPSIEDLLSASQEYSPRTSHSNGAQIGSYNSVGANDAKTNPIYTIGSNYLPTDDVLGNMYGIGYSHSNFWGAGKPTGWGLYQANAGVIKNVIADSGIWTSGGFSDAAGTRMDANGGWVRTYGSAGWYNQTYAGGWYMTDATWIRSYGSKSIYHDVGAMRTDGRLEVGPSGASFVAINGGNVGIGNTAPSYKLDVSGSMRITSGDTSYAYYGPNTTWAGGLFVGATPSRITGQSAQVISTNGNLHLDSAPTSYATYINYYSTTPTYINAAGGNVGIGTTAPSYKLDVVGGIRSTLGYTFPDGNTQAYAFDYASLTSADALGSTANRSLPTGIASNTKLYTFNGYSVPNSPYSYVSGIGFGNGTSSSIELVGSWTTASLAFRYLRDCCQNWSSWRYLLHTSQDGYITRTTHSNGYLIGSYNNVGDNSTATNPIYTIGSSYMPTDTGLGTMYGIGYSHSNFWGADKSSGWGLYVASAGSIRATISDGGFWTNTSHMIENANPTIYFQDTDNRSAMIHNNSNRLYFLRANGSDSRTWAQTGGYWPLYLDLENNDAQFGGNIYAFNYFYNSDRSLKKDIVALSGSLEKISQLNGYSFTWKGTERKDIGVIAQEVEQVYPELVGRSINASGATVKTVEYGNLVAPLIEAVKELKIQNKKQDQEIELLKEQIRLLQK